MRCGASRGPAASSASGSGRRRCAGRGANSGVWRAISLLVAVLLAGACGTAVSPSGPESPSAGPTPFPPGNPDGAAPYLVRDIRPGAAASMSDPYAGQFSSLHGRVLFDAADGTHGLE